MESLDMLANNLANAATAGYKKDGESYSLYLSAAAAEEGAAADPVTAVLPVIDHRWTDFSQGTLVNTGNPLDVALSGEGFFSVAGDGGTLYTRNGSFHTSADGYLETAEGYRVLGEDGKGIQVNPTDPVEIAADGIVSQKGLPIGRLAIVRFDDAGGLVKTAGSYYLSQDAPARATNTEVLQGRIEGSNVNTAESAVRLIHVMRQFEVLTKAVLINAEMNRRATEEVARVGS
jgi:flagellar basal-body rod protein FlgF